MRAPQTMHMLIEVHHLETIELSRNLLDLLLLIVWNVLNTWRIPFDVFTSSLLVLPTSFDGAARYFAIVDILNSVVPHRACFDLSSTHADELLVMCVGTPCFAACCYMDGGLLKAPTQSPWSPRNCI